MSESSVCVPLYRRVYLALGVRSQRRGRCRSPAGRTAAAPSPSGSSLLTGSHHTRLVTVTSQSHHTRLSLPAANARVRCSVYNACARVESSERRLACGAIELAVSRCGVSRVATSSSRSDSADPLSASGPRAGERALQVRLDVVYEPVTSVLSFPLRRGIQIFSCLVSVFRVSLRVSGESLIAI